ncbi:MAG: ABC transporter permease [Deltaproteobacteria bacterium]|nr:ABC transporter permease [Deltaproteobacteria bacterium]
MIALSPFTIAKRYLMSLQRNFVVYRKVWLTNALPNIMLPFFLFVSFGLGLNFLVGKFFYHGIEVSYVHYIAPAMISINVVFNAFFESTYSSYVRMDRQKTFDAMMATPLTMTEIMTGEILWGATKALIATAIMQAVISLFGLIQYPEGFLILPLAFLGGIAFSAFGLFFTGTLPTFEMVNLPVCLIVCPMCAVSGTFFPLQHMAPWLQWIAEALPLTHLVKITRAFSFGVMDAELWWSGAYLLVFCAIFFPLAVYVMRRRIMK